MFIVTWSRLCDESCPEFSTLPTAESEDQWAKCETHDEWWRVAQDTVGGFAWQPDDNPPAGVLKCLED